MPKQHCRIQRLTCGPPALPPAPIPRSTHLLCSCCLSSPRGHHSSLSGEDPQQAGEMAHGGDSSKGVPGDGFVVLFSSNFGKSHRPDRLILPPFLEQRSIPEKSSLNTAIQLFSPSQYTEEEDFSAIPCSELKLRGPLVK